MVLQFRHNLSDQDAAQAVCDRISWKYALSLDLDYTGFDASVLTEFRTLRLPIATSVQVKRHFRIHGGFLPVDRVGGRRAGQCCLDR